MDRTVRPGQRIGGRYEFIEPIGSGGFGTVWKARDHRLQADVAVKGLTVPPSASTAEWEERLARSEREVLNAARLRDHPNIVSVHDVIVEDDVPWIVMQLVVGRALNQRLRASGPLSVSEAADVARAMLRALGAAHAAGIVHRDIKPGNVMLADNGEILLTDFGIATHETDASLTVTGGVIGSVAYMAPERIQGDKGQAPSDLFSLGVTLHEALEGISPFTRDSTPASMHAVVYEEPPQPTRAGALTPLITRLMAKSPGDRPTIAEALALLDAPPSEAGAQVDAPNPTVVVTEVSPAPPLTPPTPTAGDEAEAPADATPPVMAQQMAPEPQPGTPPRGTTPPVGTPPPGGTPPAGGFPPGMTPPAGTFPPGMMTPPAGTYAPGMTPPAGTFPPGMTPSVGAFPPGAPPAGGFPPGPPPAGGFPSGPPPSVPPRGPGSKWLGWIVALSLAIAVAAAGGVVVLFVVSQGEDPGPGGADDGTGSGGGSFESGSSVAIEDESTAESTIEVTGVEGSAPTALGVTVDLDHTYLGDLDMALVSPDGTSFELEAFDQPHQYTVDASAADAAGTWTLRIADNQARDTGTLNSWSLDFGSGDSGDSGGSDASGGGTFESDSPVTIEDQSTAESTIEVTGVEGTAPTSLGVSVDLDHTYLTDLSIELIAPDGTSFELEAFDEPHEYTVDASSAQAAGTWTLHIEDRTAQDSGTLNSWALHF
ncbi:proprotein convertase P-domain-containing protein [Nocardiopsis mangrovi]|uniref:non-specific serine/threonine protein kinase n=1 Tax=Nocardiopsis mangrovi TaxID=1179818 RepID=A0ABV9E252_9ACTN